MRPTPTPTPTLTHNARDADPSRVQTRFTLPFAARRSPHPPFPFIFFTFLQYLAREHPPTLFLSFSLTAFPRLSLCASVRSRFFLPTDCFHFETSHSRSLTLQLLECHHSNSRSSARSKHAIENGWMFKKNLSGKLYAIVCRTPIQFNTSQWPAFRYPAVTGSGATNRVAYCCARPVLHEQCVLGLGWLNRKRLR